MSRWRSVWLVARREIIERGRSRGFVLSVAFFIWWQFLRPGDKYRDQHRDAHRPFEHHHVAQRSEQVEHDRDLQQQAAQPDERDHRSDAVRHRRAQPAEQPAGPQVLLAGTAGGM